MKPNLTPKELISCCLNGEYKKYNVVLLSILNKKLSNKRPNDNSFEDIYWDSFEIENYWISYSGSQTHTLVIKYINNICEITFVNLIIKHINISITCA